MISWCPSVEDHTYPDTPPIHMLGRCIVDLTGKILFHKWPTDKAVTHVLREWKRRGSIFQAAHFMHPYCHHPVLRQARAYMRVLAYPFSVSKDELKTRIEPLYKLEDFDREIKIVSLLDVSITTQWCLAHLRLRGTLVRDIIVSRRRMTPI